MSSYPACSRLASGISQEAASLLFPRRSCGHRCTVARASSAPVFPFAGRYSGACGNCTYRRGRVLCRSGSIGTSLGASTRQRSRGSLRGQVMGSSSCPTTLPAGGLQCRLVAFTRSKYTVKTTRQCLTLLIANTLCLPCEVAMLHCW